MKFSTKSCTSLILALFSANLFADTLIHNVKGYTFDANEQLQTFDSIIIDQGKVKSIGNSLAKSFNGMDVIDGKGKTMLPGLIDGHAHFMGLGFNLLKVDVRGVKSADATAKKVASYVKANPGLEWIIGRGWNQVLWPDKQFPTAKDLDEYVTDKPVVLTRVDGHAVWLNSKAMTLAGIDKHSVSPDGGEIVKDENGEPTGVLIDNAEQLIWQKVPEESAQKWELAFDKVNKHLLSLGITSVHDAGVGYRGYQFFNKKLAQGDFKVRVYGMLSGADEKLAEMLNKGYINDEQDLLSIRSVKIYGDGALGSRGAALLVPYDDDKENSGLLVTKPETLRVLFADIFEHDFQINIHAIGDRANKIALDEFEFAYQNKPKAKQFRNRIEHAQVVHLDDIPRFKQLAVLPSMQPTHATSDKNMAEARIGKDRLKGAYAWQTFLRQGSKVVSGSDFPVELANPFYGLHAAVTRQDRDNMPEQGWLSHEALTLEQALKSFTLDAAYGAHQEQKLGSLQAGKWADFILIDRDIFNIPAKDLWKTKVLETWIGGKPLYRSHQNK